MQRGLGRGRAGYGGGRESLLVEVAVTGFGPGIFWHLRAGKAVISNSSNKSHAIGERDKHSD